jgi:hypothetical protein
MKYPAEMMSFSIIITHSLLYILQMGKSFLVQKEQIQRKKVLMIKQRRLSLLVRITIEVEAIRIINIPRGLNLWKLIK